MDTDGPAAGISFIVRVVRARHAVTGIVERVQTGEKHRFASTEEMRRIIDRIVHGRLGPEPERETRARVR